MKTQYTLRSTLFMVIALMSFTRYSICANPPISSCELDIIVPDDITICSADDFDIDADINGDYLEFIWTQDGEFLTDSDLNPSVYIDGTTSFTLTAYQMNDENLIINGDFESGDWIEYTDYYEGDGNCTSSLGYLACEGTYGVIDNPNLGHDFFDPCGDHTGGGNMMVVNGASSLQQIWCQTIDVEPDGIYSFSAWGASVNPSSPALLQFAIDGQLIGNLFSLSSTTCQWEEFTAEWEASGQTTVEICITNQNTAAGGNDFAIDDIAFYEICESSSSFTVTFAAFEVDWNTPEDITCINNESEIELFLDGDYDYSIEWETNEGNIIAEEYEGTYLLVDEPGEYFVTITNEFGCEEELDIEVEPDTLSPPIVLSKSNDLNCEDHSALLVADAIYNGIDITWYNSEDALLVEDDELEVNSSGWYTAHAYDDDNGCSSTDSIFVDQDTLLQDLSIISTNALNCKFAESTLLLTNSFESVIWKTASDTLAIDSDSISVNEGGTYSVIVQGTNSCIDSANIFIEEEVSVFEYTLDYATRIDCQNPVSFLNISFDSLAYEVQFENSDVIPDTSIELSQSGTFFIEIIDTIGCTKQDSITIEEDFIQPALTVYGDTISCQKPVATLSVVTTASTINWIAPAGQIYSGDSLETAVPGVYKVEVIGDNGCITTDSLELTNSELIPDLAITGDTLSCNNTSIDLIPVSNQSDLQYSWELPDYTTSTAELLSTSQAGIYNLVVTNAEGCSASAQYLVLDDYAVPDIELTNYHLLDCNNTDIPSDLNVLGEIDYVEWEGPGLSTNDNQINFTEAGVFYLEAFGLNGCSTVDSVIVEMDTIAPDVEIIDVPILNCTDTIIQPLINIPANYDNLVWMGANFSSTDEMINLTEAGNYSLFVTGNNGCTTEEYFTVQIDTIRPDFNFMVSTIDCSSPNAQISIEDNPSLENAAAYVHDSIEQQGFELTVEPTEGVYLEVTGTNGCIHLEYIDFLFDTIAPPILADVPNINCTNDPVQVQVLNESDFLELNLLQNNIDLGDISTSIDQPGFFQITGLGSNGCSSELNIEIEAIENAPQIIDYNESSIDCSEATLLNWIDITSGTAPFEIIVDGRPYSEEALPIIIEGAGIHDIQVSDSYGCTDKTTIEVEAIEMLTLDLTSNILIQEGEEVQLELQVSPGIDLIENIQWIPATYLSCDDCLNPLAEPIEDIGYDVVVQDIYGCESVASVSIDIENELNVYIPNIISLSDFRNDKFSIHFGNGDVQRINFLNIYDRWGNLVFKVENFDPAVEDIYWNGSYNNSNIIPGVYVYMVDLLLEDDKTKLFVGDITVIK